MSTFVAYWDGGPLSAIEQLSLTSFVARGHAVELFSYGTPAGVPAGVTVRDAATVLPRDERTVALLERRAYSKISDLLRYLLLTEPGRTWVDVDVILLADDVPSTPTLFAREDDVHVNGAVLRLEPDSTLHRRLLEETVGLSAEELLSTPHGFPGPLLLTRVLDELDLKRLALPPEALYPVASRDLWRLYDPRERDWCDRTLRGATTLHLWNEFLRRADLKDKRPPRGSWLDRAMRTHGVTLPSAKVDLRWIRGPWRQMLPDPPPAPAPRAPLRALPRRAARWLVRRLRTLLQR
jgi:hypothetical protein